MKAILVVDIPDQNEEGWEDMTEWCIEGELYGRNKEVGYWVFCNEIVEAPLKPMPSKCELLGVSKESPLYEDILRAEGFNACLEELEK